MEKFKNVMKAFAKDDSGAALVEYAVILGVIVAVGGAVLVIIGTNVGDILDVACGVIESVPGTTATC
jgi:Flp pilus assembly pilin Flp